jgi:radical SAM superfamily enzyme YgiQ (UPF0313 family)
MGRQPFGLASPAAWLRAAGWTVEMVDVSRERLTVDAIAAADFAGVYLPMHTAARLATAAIQRIRRIKPSVRVCAFGLYAPLNAEWLRSIGVDHILGGEFEEELAAIAAGGAGPAAPSIPRVHFMVPDRSGLPPLDRYATLQLPDGTRRIVGYTEASRGCRHLCRHCPVVPVYNGQFRIVPADVVLADIDRQVEAGARHVTFGDPDFFNGPTHAMRIVDGLRRAHAGVTYDVTIKVEHLLRHRDLLPGLRETGCLFVTSAIESIDDRVLGILQKGHTRRDFVDAVALCREAGLTLSPTFVAFHPWTTLDGYCELLETIESLDLIPNVAPIQLAIRLLIPNGSRMLEVDEVRRLADRFDPVTLTYRWAHPDPRVDALQRELSDMVGVRLNNVRAAVFDEIRRIAFERAGRAVPHEKAIRDRATVPYLNEPWYC